MKKLKLIATLIVVVFAFNLFGCASNNTPLTAEQIYNNSKNCAVEIITYTKSNQELSLGSGFVFSSDGKIVTNYHVIEEAYSAKVYIGENSFTVNNVLAYSVDKDIAVLKIKANNLKTLKINYNTPNTGSTVYALGSSRGLTSTFSSGIVTTASREIDGVKYIQHDAAISNGNSGGPLINDKGEIIGINTLTIRDSQNLNFAISAQELNTLDYSTPLTLAQVYDKESNDFLKLKNFIIKYGEYDYQDKDYFYYAGAETLSSGSIVSTASYYNTITGNIELVILYDDFLLLITVKENSTTCPYIFYDGDYYISGNLYQTSFSTSTTYISHSSTNIYSSSLLQSGKELTLSLAKLLILYVDIDYSSAGVTAYGLGFVNF